MHSATAGIGFDHQAFPLRIIRPVETPPVGDGVHGQVGCVGRGGHAHVTLIPLRIARLVEPETAGNPCTGEKWVRSRLRSLSEALERRACPTTIGRLLRKQGYGLRSHRKGSRPLPGQRADRCHQAPVEQRRATMTTVATHPNSVAEKLTGRSYVSFSALSTYRQCPLRYAFRYIEGRPEEASWATA